MRHQSRSYAVQALYQSEMLQSKSMLHCDRFLEHSHSGNRLTEACAGILTAGS